MNPNVENYHLIQAYFVGPTDFKPGYIALYSLRFKEKIKIDFDYDYDSIVPDCLAWFEAHGFEIIGKGEALQGFIFISETFKPIDGAFQTKTILEAKKIVALREKEKAQA